jgi:hypothetical protein
VIRLCDIQEKMGDGGAEWAERRLGRLIEVLPKAKGTRGQLRFGWRSDRRRSPNYFEKILAAECQERHGAPSSPPCRGQVGQATPPTLQAPCR